MHTITNAADLRQVGKEACLSPALHDEVEQWLWDIWRAVGGDDPEAFSLEATGPIVILEPNDRPDAVPGGCRTAAEWANVVTVAGRPYYDAGVLEGNDRCWRLLGQVGTLHPAVEAYLAREAHAEGSLADEAVS